MMRWRLHDAARIDLTEIWFHSADRLGTIHMPIAEPYSKLL